MYQSVLSGAFRGLDSFLVQVEVDVSNGLLCMEMVGYLANEVKESRDRVRVGIRNSGFEFPVKRVTISLTPADVRKGGSGFDLPVALGILAAGEPGDTDVSEEKLNQEFTKKTLVIGELGLDGEVKSVRGVLPILLKASREGVRNCILPYGNMKEAGNVKNIHLFPVKTLREAFEVFKTGKGEVKPEKASGSENKAKEPLPDFAQIKGQEQAKRAAEIAAAGFHNLLLFGPPGSGKSMIAERIPTILPEMTYEECLEVTQIYSVAGLLDPGTGLVRKRPYERPHHTITPAALTGGGTHPMPGAITLAHKGVLFLDELPEFGREKLDLLRQPLEEKKIRIIRNQYSCDYQCDFMFVAAMNPCPCGFYPDRRKCRCKENEVRRYLKRVSGPILDRMDISVEVGKIEYKQLKSEEGVENSKTIQKRVERAHEIQLERQGKYNSALTNKELDEVAMMDEDAAKILGLYFDKKELSIRGYQRIRKIARTIADLREAERISKEDVAEAILLNGGMEKVLGKGEL